MENEEEITEGSGKKYTLLSIKMVIIVWLIALIIIVPMFLFLVLDDEPPLIRIKEDSAVEGRYLGVVQGDTRKIMSRIMITIYDDSNGLSFSMTPSHQRETIPHQWPEDPPVLNCTFFDKNANCCLDKGDEFVFNNVEEGDSIHIIWKPTGSLLFSYTF